MAFASGLGIVGAALDIAQAEAGAREARSTQRKALATRLAEFLDFLSYREDIAGGARVRAADLLPVAVVLGVLGAVALAATPARRRA